MLTLRNATILAFATTMLAGNFSVSRLSAWLPNALYGQIRFVLLIACVGLMLLLRRTEATNRSSSKLALVVTALCAFLALHAAVFGAPDFRTGYIIDLLHFTALAWIAVHLLRTEGDLKVLLVSFIVIGTALIPMWFAGLSYFGPITFYRIEFMAFVAALYLALCGTRWLYLALPVFLFCTMASLSKAAVVCALIAIVYAIHLLAVMRQDLRKLVSAGVIGATIFGAVSLADFTPRLNIMEQPDLTTPQMSNMITINDASQRIRMALVAIDLAKRNIVRGTGVGSYHVTVMNSDENGFDSMRHPHNVTLEILYSTGLIGVTLFGIALFIFFVSLHRRVIAYPPVSAIAAGVVFVLLTNHLSGDFYDFRMFWLLIIPAWRPPTSSASLNYAASLPRARLKADASASTTSAC